MLKGELDWVVMKALEKDRTHRYETANGLARDIQRYLTNESVEACPASAAYRFRKFARRNRATLATVTLVAVALPMDNLGQGALGPLGSRLGCGPNRHLHVTAWHSVNR